MLNHIVYVLQQNGYFKILHQSFKYTATGLHKTLDSVVKRTDATDSKHSPVPETTFLASHFKLAYVFSKVSECKNVPVFR